MNNIFSTVKKSFTYEEFLTLNKELVAEGKTTSNNDEQKYIDFGKLNLQRMLRLNKTIKIPESISNSLKEYKNQEWYVITEGWCGDSAQVLPFIAKLADSAGIELKIILRDEHPDIMDNYLTNGSKSIPILVILEEGKQVAVWGPRPWGASVISDHYKANKDYISFEDFEIELQKWYNKNNGEETMKEILEKIKHKTQS